jgi:hypothetical protein
VDVLLKLRVLIWVLVISLWGLMVYQYLGEDEKEARTMHAVAYRPVETTAPSPEIPAADAPPPAPASSDGVASGPPAALPAAAAPAAALVVPGATADPTRIVLPAPGASGPAPSDDREPSGETPVPEAPSAPAPAPAPRAARVARLPRAAPRPRAMRREDRTQPMPDPPVPPGFQKSVTRHFNVYSEQYAASDALLELIENIHDNLMLDLAPFSPWANDQRVSVFLFKNQDTYRRMTGRPAWSGGASSVAKRKVYLFESEELPGILAHELTHIYFDGFFLDGTIDPLWLSEGMATLVQVERGLAAPNWLRENLAILEAGGGVPIDEFAAAKTTAGWPDEKVRLWYAQAFSMVRYLIRTQYRSSFYKFAEYLREGRPAPEALYRAYGAPYTRMRALEIAWRHEISHSSTNRTPAGR